MRPVVVVHPRCEDPRKLPSLTIAVKDCPVRQTVNSVGNQRIPTKLQIGQRGQR